MASSDFPPPLLGSFWGGGFDSITPYSRLGGHEQRLDLIVATEHDRRAEHDYWLLSRMGMRWTREDVRWYLCEPEPGQYRFAHLEPLARAARRYQMEVVWSWMHYGCPLHVDPLAPEFPARLAELGLRFLAWLREQEVGARIIAPINELSYFAWHVDHLGTWYPFAKGEGRRLKDQLMAAHRHCYERIKEVAPEVRVLLIDPFYYAVGSEDDPESLAEAAFWREAALEAMDRLAAYTDLIGMNFYYDGQVACYRRCGERALRRRTLAWDDPRRLSLVEALRLYHRRFGKPILVTETSIRAGRRLPWFSYLTDQAMLALQEHLPLEGLCWYPVLDVPDWGDLAADRTLHHLSIAHAGLIRLDRTRKGLRRSVLPEVVWSVRLQEERIEQARRAADAARATPTSPPAAALPHGDHLVTSRAGGASGQ